jgi:hypothetical protein
MKKGKNRRHREARELKQRVWETRPAEDAGATAEAVERVCVECGREPHAEWCLAEPS